jgi:hypothetical protein
MTLQLGKHNNQNKRKRGDNVNYSKLKGKITEVFGTNKDFAAAMGMDAASISFRLNNQIPWKHEEIEKACSLLGIPIQEVHLYFFSRKS